MDNNARDDEINLKPYLLGILRRWYVVLLVALLGATAAMIMANLGPDSYSATATVLAFGERPNFQFDPRYSTSNVFVLDRYSRREGLKELVINPAIESQIPPEVIAQLELDEYKLGDLTGRISAETNADIITISASGKSPENAQLLANAWAKAYVKYINALYGVDSTAIMISEQQVAEAEASYAAAQSELETFLATSGSTLVQDRIQNISSLLDGSQNANITRFTDLVTRAQALDLVVQDAELLRTQLASGSSVDVGDRLTTLGLRAQAIGGLSMSVQLQVDGSSASSATPEQAVQELDLFITSVRGQIDGLRDKIASTSDTILSNGPALDSSITLEERDVYYDQLNELRRQQEEMSGREAALKQKRDVALETLQIVERKRSEQLIAQIQPAFEVRLASEALVPQHPVSRGIPTRAILGGLAGLTIGTLTALLLTIFAPVALLRSRRPKLGQTADRPSYS